MMPAVDDALINRDNAFGLNSLTDLLEFIKGLGNL